MTQTYIFSSFVQHHNHAAAILQRNYDHDGEVAMLHLAARLATPLDQNSYVFRAAARGIHHDNPSPAANSYPELNAHSPLSAYGPVCLHREFSHRNEPTDNTDSEILCREFVQWLPQRFKPNRHLGSYNPHRFDQGEAVALPHLHRAWNDATRNA